LTTQRLPTAIWQIGFSMFEIKENSLYEITSTREIKILDLHPSFQKRHQNPIPQDVGVRLAIYIWAGTELNLSLEECYYWYSKCLTNPNGIKALRTLYG
jgi:hypothetical protein